MSRDKKPDKNLRFAIFLAGALSCVLALVLAVVWVIDTRPPSPSSSVTSAARKPEEKFTAIPEHALRSAAEAGDPAAQFKLGSLLFQEPGRSAATSAEAVKWLQAAAESGNTEAMIFLGRLSRTGVGILQDYSQTVNWIQMAAERGNPEGMLEMGRLCRDGVGVEKNPIQAYAWFNRAAAEHNLDAVTEREIISKILTAEELKQAQHLSAELAKKHVQRSADSVAQSK